MLFRSWKRDQENRAAAYQSNSDQNGHHARWHFIVKHYDRFGDRHFWHLKIDEKLEIEGGSGTWSVKTDTLNSMRTKKDYTEYYVFELK